MFKIKKIGISIIGALAALACIPFVGHATDPFGPITLTPGIVNVVGGSTSNAPLTAIIDCRKQASVAVNLQFGLVAASTTNTVTLTLGSQLDQTTADTSTKNDFTIALVGAGTGTVSYTTNLTVGGIPFLSVKSIANSAGVDATNIVVRYIIKALP